MIDLSATISAMEEAGMSPDQILLALRCVRTESVGFPQMSARISAISARKEEAAERRRAYDRERKRALRNAQEQAEGGKMSANSTVENAEVRRGGYIDTPPLSIDSEGSSKGITREDHGEADWKAFKGAYPKRAGDYDWKKARAKFHRIIEEGVPAAVIISGVARYAVLCDAEGKTGTQFVRQPTTWLNNEGWNNDYTPSRKQSDLMDAFDRIIERNGGRDRRHDEGREPWPPGDEPPPAA